MNVYTKKSGQPQHDVLSSSKLSLPGYKMYEINLNKNQWNNLLPVICYAWKVSYLPFFVLFTVL